MRKTKFGQELIAGLEEVLEYSRGNKKGFRTTELEVPEPARHWRKDQIARLRKRRFKVSQPVFASYLSVKVSTIRAWEQGLKSPSGAARRLLEVAAIAPEIFKRINRESSRMARSL
jgi:putative transcriptional regulator